MDMFFGAILFLALSNVPEAADRMAINTAAREMILELSEDGWLVFDFREDEKSAIGLANRRDDRVFVSERKDFPRVAVYLAALDEMGCDICEKLSMTRPQTCGVHGEIPGVWIDAAQILEKPEDGWPRGGKLRFHGDDKSSVTVITREDGDGLDIGLTLVGPDGTSVGLLGSVRWNEAEEAEE